MLPGDVSSILLEHTQDKIAVVDEEGTFVYVGGAVESILGYAPESLVGEDAFAYVHPDDREAARDTFERAIGADSPQTETARYRYRASDGSWRWLESRFSNVTDPELGGYVVSSRDVTRRVEAERDRQEARDRLRELSESVDDVLWMFDADWSELLFVNPAYEDVFGQSTEDLADDPASFLEAIHPDDRECVEAAMERLSAGDTIDIEYRVNPDTDYGRWVWVQGNPIEEDGEVVRVVGFTRDVTDRRRRERQLVVMDNLLRHNLRNDMDVVLGNAELVARTADDPTAERAELIRRQGEKLLETAEKQREIIDLLTDGTVPHAVDVVEVVTDAVETVRRRYPGVDVETRLPDVAEATGLRELRLAVTELVANAVEHNAQGSPEVTVTVRVDDGTVELEVADDCPAIPEMEYRVLTGDWTMDSVYHTSGLGLWLVYWVVDLSDGRIDFRRDDRGNVVTVSLPRPTG